MEDPGKEKTSNMEPFIKLMRRYVIECADLHDEAVYDKYNEIMEPLGECGGETVEKCPEG